MHIVSLGKIHSFFSFDFRVKYDRALPECLFLAILNSSQAFWQDDYTLCQVTGTFYLNRNARTQLIPDD